MTKNQQNILILEDIRSVQNVGSIFRTAETAQISKIYLTGHTPTPLDRFGKRRKDLAKIALGAEELVPWEFKKRLIPLLSKLKKAGYLIIAIEQDKNSVDYKKIKIGKKNVFILGTEVSGISKKVLQKCDLIAEIPMKGKKESLNVSVAFGVAIFRILNI